MRGSICERRIERFVLVGIIDRGEKEGSWWRREQKPISGTKPLKRRQTWPFRVHTCVSPLSAAPIPISRHRRHSTTSAAGTFAHPPDPALRYTASPPSSFASLPTSSASSAPRRDATVATSASRKSWPLRGPITTLAIPPPGLRRRPRFRLRTPPRCLSLSTSPLTRTSSFPQTTPSPPRPMRTGLYS